MRTKCFRRESSSSGELNQAITPTEWKFIEVHRFRCKLDIFELGKVFKYASADRLEVFVEDDAFEGGASVEHNSSMTVSLSGRVILVRAH